MLSEISQRLNALISACCDQRIISNINVLRSAKTTLWANEQSVATCDKTMKVFIDTCLICQLQVLILFA